MKHGLLHEEFYVCGAAGYPDPYQCDTLEEARRFALNHEFNHRLQRKVEVTIRRRLVSDNEVVWTNAAIGDPCPWCEATGRCKCEQCQKMNSDRPCNPCDGTGRLVHLLHAYEPVAPGPLTKEF